MNTEATNHLSATKNIIELILSEFYDKPDPPDADFNLENSLVELLLYRALDHIASAAS